MKNLLFYLSSFFLFQQSIAQYTQVPDPNFEQALIDLGIDSEGVLDGQFLTNDAVGVINLYIDNKNINDLTGIESFTDLEVLFAPYNNIETINTNGLSQNLWWLSLGHNELTSVDLTVIPNIVNYHFNDNYITSIDVSNLTQAFGLDLSDNPLVEITLNNTHIQLLGLSNTPITSIDLSSVSSLQRVTIQESQIQTLDFSSNLYLEEVRAHNTPLTSINLPNNPNLEKLYIWETQLTELDITNCNGLIELKASNIGLTELDLSGNPNLEILSAPFNQLSTLDVSQNINLKDLYISNNLVLGTIDLSNNVNLENINCLNNLLTEIDLSNNELIKFGELSENPNLEIINAQNGNNENINIFIAVNCPQLSCVVVDDPLADNSNFIVDENATLVGSIEDCNLSLNENELQKLINLYPNPVKDVLNIKTQNSISINSLQIFNILGSVVYKTDHPDSLINVSNLASGLLFVKLETNKGVITKKVIKE